MKFIVFNYYFFFLLFGWFFLVLLLSCRWFLMGIVFLLWMRWCCVLWGLLLVWIFVLKWKIDLVMWNLLLLWFINYIMFKWCRWFKEECIFFCSFWWLMLDFVEWLFISFSSLVLFVRVSSLLYNFCWVKIFLLVRCFGLR